jgi:glycosyltransferase involved in cell wall biosynthesis
MPKRKNIILTKLFDSGGSNSHFKTLIRYFGAENIILLLENERELTYLSTLTTEPVKVKIIKRLRGYAYLRSGFIKNVKELVHLSASILRLFIMSVRYGFASVTISAVEPERHLYLFWLPFIREYYILHSQPHERFTAVTTSTCDLRLSKNKRIITVSDSMRQHIIDNWQISTSKQKFVLVIPNCMAEHTMADENAKFENKSKKLVLTVGHVDLRKNPSLWLKVAESVTATMPDVQFTWIGNGPYLASFLSKTENNANICFAGHTDTPHDYFSKADIYYQPSLEEPHGIAVIEAMYHGLSCVVSDTGGLPESVSNGYNGIVVPPTDEDQHTSAIIHLLDNESVMLEYGLNSQKRYNELFTYTTFKRKMDAIYN